MAIPNAIGADFFLATALADGITKDPFEPAQVRSLTVFEPRFLTTRHVTVEERDGVLGLIQSSEPGQPLIQNTTNLRVGRTFAIRRYGIAEHVKAHEVQDVRAFAMENMLQDPNSEAMARLASMRRMVDATEEHLFLGALKGTILDADGTTTIHNLFTEFGVTQTPEKAFDFAGAADGDIQALCGEIKRDIYLALGADSVRVQAIHCLMSPEFAEAFWKNAEVRTTFLRPASEMLRRGQAFESWPFGGINFEEYRGMDDGSGAFIPANKAIFFPIVSGLYRAYYAPADWWSTVNTQALPRYARTLPDPEDRGVNLEVQTNVLPLCLKPKALLIGRDGA